MSTINIKSRPTQLVDGCIPPNSACPFKDECCLDCPKKEVTDRTYSCGAALGFDLTYNKPVVEEFKMNEVELNQLRAKFSDILKLSDLDGQSYFGQVIGSEFVPSNKAECTHSYFTHELAVTINKIKPGINKQRDGDYYVTIPHPDCTGMEVKVKVVALASVSIISTCPLTTKVSRKTTMYYISDKMMSEINALFKV